MKTPTLTIHKGDRRRLTPRLKSGHYHLIYIRPPHPTTRRTPTGLHLPLLPHLHQAHRLLTPQGALILHLKSHEIHHYKNQLDKIFGPKSYINEIIWTHPPARQKRPLPRWPVAHDNLLWYAKNPAAYTYRHDSIDRIPYLAPGLVTKEKAAKGKTPTDVWWQRATPLIHRLITAHTHPGDHILDYYATDPQTARTARRTHRHLTQLIGNKKNTLESPHD